MSKQTAIAGEDFVYYAEWRDQHGDISSLQTGDTDEMAETAARLESEGAECIKYERRYFPRTYHSDALGAVTIPEDEA